MKIERFIFISAEGIEFKLEHSQLESLLEYLRRQEATDRLAAEAKLSLSEAEFIDPEDFERAAQAEHFVRRRRSLTKVV
jgi:Holliday junction resolvase